MNTTFKLFILSVVVFCLSFQKINAQQIAGGEITYTCKGSDQYEITLIIYTKCPSTTLASSYDITCRSLTSSDRPIPLTLTKTGDDVVIKACENAISRCSGGNPLLENTETIIKRVYKNTVKLPKKAKDWVFKFATGNRTADITNATQSGIYLQATLNNTGTLCNNSSTFNNLPAFFSPEGTAVNYDPGITNTDRDGLQVSLINPMVTDNIKLAYNTPFSATQPFSTTSPIVVNASNGRMSYTPSNQGEKSTLAIQVKEFKNGVEVGSVMREMYTQTLAKKEAAPYFNGENVYTFCQGTPGSITIDGLSDVSGVSIDMTVTGATASEYTISKSNQKATLKLNVSANSVSTRRITITIFDSKCGKTTKDITVKVVSKPVITNPITDSIILCKKDFNFTVNTINGAPPYTYLWNTGSTAQSTPVFDTKTYSVTVTDTNKCTATWSRNVTSPINFSFGKSRCVDDAISFANISNIPGIDKYNWTFGGVSVPNAGPNPTHKFPSTGTFDVTMEIADANNCTNSITKKINIFPKPIIDFVATDTCQKTELSDLKVKHTLTPTVPDTSTSLSNIRYLVNGTVTIPANNPETNLQAVTDGIYKVKLTATNDAGCTSVVEKSLKVRKKPTYEFYPKVAKYFYRCDSPSSIDTVFKFQVKSAPDLAAFPMNLTVQRVAYPDSIVKKYISLDNIIVPYNIVQNASNGVTIKMKDTLGCTNDTAVIIQDPITPNLVLTKYYCFLNDTLKIQDLAYKPNQYHWGLDSLRWDLKDGSFDTTRGFVNHVYTNKLIDEARISLYVRDKNNCVDTTNASKIRVFLSEPDTSQFALSKSEACNIKDTVVVTGIKNKYINSWYYRLNDKPELIFTSTTDTKWIPNKAFGKSIPDVDTFKVNTSKKYIATAGIFYNDSVATQPGRGCKLTVQRNWQVLNKLTFSIDPAYNHCKDSVKFFKAKFTGVPVPGLKLDTTSWRWKLVSPSPKNVIIDQSTSLINNELAYNPSPSLFTEVATTQSSFIGKYPPYKLKVYFEYLSDNNTRCIDTTTQELLVGNEVVKAEIKENDPTCALYSNDLFIVNTDLFNLENDTKIWNYGNGEPLDTIPRNRIANSLYPKEGKYLIKTVFINQFGCTGSDTSSIFVKKSPSAILNVNIVCDGALSKLVASDTIPQSKGNTYYWYIDKFTDKIPSSSSNINIPDTTISGIIINSDSILTQKLAIGSNPVFLAVKNIEGCFSQTKTPEYAIVNPNPKAIFDAIAVNTQDSDYLGNQPIAFDDQTDTTGLGGKLTWTWNMGDGVKLVSDSTKTSFDITYTYPYYAPPFPASKNTYTVTLDVKTKANCPSTASKILDLNAYFVMPSAFSPNEDGLHDFLIGVGKGIRELKEFKLFNRWGEEVQSIKGVPTKDAENRGYLLWDGKYKGDAQPVGSYVYYAVVITGNGDELVYKGNLALVK